jgi:PAS domain S-box-containing protein
MRGDEVRHLDFHTETLPAEDGTVRLLRGTVQDITDRKRAEEERQQLSAAIQRERDRLAALVNSMTDEIWFADAEKRLTLVNPAVWATFGSSVGDANEVEQIAARFEVYRPDGTARPVEEAPPLRALRGETVTGQEEIVRTPDTGQLRHRQVNAAPVRDRDGAIIGSVSVVRDITDRKRGEEALEKAKAAAEEANRQKDHFLAVLGHELRNPLAPISNSVALLKRLGPQDPALRRAHDMIDRQVAHMTRLIEDLLDVSRIARGKIAAPGGTRPDRGRAACGRRPSTAPGSPRPDAESHRAPGCGGHPR